MASPQLLLTAGPVPFGLLPAPPPPHVTHEEYIHAAKAIVLRNTTPAIRDLLKDVKVVYGAGQKNLRGVCYHTAWDGKHALIEVGAFGEESPVQLCGTLVHELAHAMDMSVGHSKVWKENAAILGLLDAQAAGHVYTWDSFHTDIRAALQALPVPTDGSPLFKHGGIVIPPKPRTCNAGIGTRGGKARGAGSGSRLRLYTCECGVKVRVASDEFNATCNRCDTKFAKPV